MPSESPPLAALGGLVSSASRRRNAAVSLWMRYLAGTLCTQLVVGVHHQFYSRSRRWKAHSTRFGANLIFIGPVGQSAETASHWRWIPRGHGSPADQTAIRMGERAALLVPPVQNSSNDQWLPRWDNYYPACSFPPHTKRRTVPPSEVLLRASARWTSWTASREQSTADP
jgi:hypothetical protein